MPRHSLRVTRPRAREVRSAEARLWLAAGMASQGGASSPARAPAHVEATRPTRAYARSGPLGATTPSQGSSLEAGSSLVTFQRRLPTCQIFHPGRHFDCSGRKMVDPHIAEKLCPTRKRGQQGRRPAAALDGAPSACYTRVSVGKSRGAPEKEPDRRITTPSSEAPFHLTALALGQPRHSSSRKTPGAPAHSQRSGGGVADVPWANVSSGTPRAHA